MFHPAPSRHACTSPNLSTAGFKPGSIPRDSTIPFSGKRRFWKQQLPLNILLEARRLVKFLLGQPHSAQCQISSPILVPVLAPGDILLQSSRVAEVVQRCEMVQQKGQNQHFWIKNVCLLAEFILSGNGGYPRPLPPLTQNNFTKKNLSRIGGYLPPPLSGKNSLGSILRLP